MMKKINSLFILLIVVFSFHSVYATGGYFRHGYGIKYSALAGAGTALSLSSIGAAQNPAGLAFLGKSIDVNIALFNPDRSYTITGNPTRKPGTMGLQPGKFESDSKAFVMPTMGANFELNKKMTLGIIFYGNGGMNTDYPFRTFYDQNSSTTGVNLEQMFFGVTYAIKVSENHAFGITPLFAYQRFSAKGLANFAPYSSDPTALSGNRLSTSSGFGLRVGYQGKILPELSLGLSYQTKFAMSEFDEYKGLFAEKGDFDIPSSWNAGIAFEGIKDFTVAIDFQQIRYSEVASIANKIDPMALPPAFPNQQGGFTPNTNQVPLGSDNGSGFGWEDINIVKFGVMYKGVKDWTFMAGASFGQNPVKEEEVLFNILAPGVMKTHLTFGVSHNITKHQEITLAFMYAPENTVNGANRFEAPNAQTIELAMNQFQVEIGYAFH